MANVKFQKILIGIFLALFAFECLSSVKVNVVGRVLRVVDGKIEVKTKNGITKITLKKLPKKQQELAQEAMVAKREIQLSVTVDSIANTK